MVTGMVESCNSSSKCNCGSWKWNSLLSYLEGLDGFHNQLLMMPSSTVVLQFIFEDADGSWKWNLDPTLHIIIIHASVSENVQSRFVQRTPLQIWATYSIWTGSVGSFRSISIFNLPQWIGTCKHKQSKISTRKRKKTWEKHQLREEHVRWR